ncbi:hypothetical protein DV738_g2490, partial [Chaetothyriales sp. CBS 135597]
MSSARRKANPPTRRVPLPDTDSESDGDSLPKRARAPELSQEEKDRNAISMSIADLGSARRSEITGVDKGRPQPVNITKLLQGRDCELPGSAAAKLAAENKSQLTSWCNFGSTAIAKSAANEQLDNIANGQSHRQAMAERLRQEGVLTLEDSYDERVRHKPAPAPIKDYRPLDPAVVAGEKDSRYGRGGLQAMTKSKSSASGKPNVLLHDSTVKVSRPSTGDRVVQKRPWPPKGLEHLVAAPPLADPNSFMAAVTKTLPKLQASSNSATKRPAAVKGPSVPAMTIQGASLTVKAAEPVGDKRPVAKACGNGSGTPNIRPDGFTEGKSGEEMLISPYLEGESAETGMSAPLDPEIVGVGTKPGSPLSTRTAKKAQFDADRIQNFVEKEEIAGLVKYLKQALGMKSGDPMQESTLPALLQSEKANSTANVDSKTAPTQAPPSPEWTKSLNDSIWALPASKTESTSGRVALKALTNKENVSGSFKARTTPMSGDEVKEDQPKRSMVEADSSAVFGDVTALCRLPGVELAGSRGPKGVKVEEDKTNQTKIKRTAAGPGYEALVREMEQAKKQSEAEKVMMKTTNVSLSPVKQTLNTTNPTQSPVKQTLNTTNLTQSPVTQTLKYADSVARGLDFGGWRARADSDSSDDWKL